MGRILAAIGMLAMAAGRFWWGAAGFGISRNFFDTTTATWVYASGFVAIVLVIGLGLLMLATIVNSLFD